MSSKRTLQSMIKIYSLQCYDWMGYPITRDNPITFHHIQKAADNGELTIENGAIITRFAHTMLHKLEKVNPSLYEEYNYMFKIINDMNCPPTFEIIQIMAALRIRLEQTLNKGKIQRAEEEERQSRRRVLVRRYKETS